MTHRVLVVEDHPLNRELLTEWLESEGYRVVVTATLGEARRALEREPPDAILLDVQLGTASGLDLATWVRAQPSLRRLPIIAVTAHAMMVDQERILAAGCDVWLPKPISFAVLEGHLRRLLETADAERGGR